MRIVIHLVAKIGTDDNLRSGSGGGLFHYPCNGTKMFSHTKYTCMGLLGPYHDVLSWAATKSKSRPFEHWSATISMRVNSECNESLSGKLAYKGEIQMNRRISNWQKIGMHSSLVCLTMTTQAGTQMVTLLNGYVWPVHLPDNDGYYMQSDWRQLRANESPWACRDTTLSVWLSHCN